MKRKSLVVVSTLLVAIIIATVLASCSSGKYYFRDSDGKLIKDGAYLIVTPKTLEYKDKGDKGDYIIKGTLKKTSEETATYEGKEYKVVVYAVSVTSIKLGDTTYKYKDGKWEGAGIMEAAALAVLAGANSRLVYDSESGMAALGVKPMFKSNAK